MDSLENRRKEYPDRVDGRGPAAAPGPARVGRDRGD
jgi:hypothetical protein